jgi:predicted TPR repeat methyltransferase
MTGGPLFVSSGDVTADQHYRSALQRAARGDLAGAAEILVQTVQLAPAFATAWFALGAVRDSLGDRAGAIVAWRKANDADPEDYHGARLQLARLGAGEDTPAMTAAYVRRLFDQQAASFDETLLQRLDYRGPAVLLEAVRNVTGTGLRFRLHAGSRVRHRTGRGGVSSLCGLACGRGHIAGDGSEGAFKGPL